MLLYTEPFDSIASTILHLRAGTVKPTKPMPNPGLTIAIGGMAVSRTT